MQVELTTAEALVLYEWIQKNSGKNDLFDDPAEQCVFWNMDCQIEKELVDIFAADYAERLARAREEVRETY